MIDRVTLLHKTLRMKEFEKAGSWFTMSASLHRCESFVCSGVLMKTKIVKSDMCLELLVVDDRVNALFGCTPEKPILLMSTTDRSMGDVSEPMWNLSDWRLTKHMPPNPYGLDRPYESIHNLSSEAYERFKALVPVHRKEGNDIFWSTFVGTVPGPLQVEDALAKAKPERMGVTITQAICFMDAGKEGRWSFKQAKEQILKAQQEWAAVTIKTKEDMLAMRKPNLHLQISEMDFGMAERAHEALGLFSQDDVKKILAIKTNP